MLTILRRTISLWWRTWPWLAAIYLIGWFLRYWALHLAIHVALGHGDFWGSLILPLAPLARLLTYLAMFLVIRTVAPGLQRVETDGEQAKGVADVVMTAILPFLVIYTAWKLIVEDYYVYVTSVGHTLLSDWKFRFPTARARVSPPGSRSPAPAATCSSSRPPRSTASRACSSPVSSATS